MTIACMDKAGRAEEVEALIREIQRYLRLLDALRRSNRPPEGRSGERSTK
jgi:hypothetical protein